MLHPAAPSVPLPLYPWQRDRYWTSPGESQQVRLGLLDPPAARPVFHGPRGAVWESRLDTETLPYLADHRVQGTAVFPAAGYLEMAAQAVRALTGGTDAVLAAVDLRKALFLAEDASRTVELSVSLENGDFTIASVPEGPDTERAVHASGVIRTGQRRSPGPALDTDAVRGRSRRHLRGAECYAGLAALGYHYGPAFQAIEEVWIGADEVLARVRPPAAIGDDAARHHIHPVLLDACFQSLLTPGIPAEDAPPPTTGIRLPLSLDEMSVAPVGDRPLWVHGTVSRNDGDELVGDLSLYAEDETALGWLRGFRAADVEKASTAVSRSTIDGWLAEPAWIDRPWQEAGDGADGTLAGERQDWLVLTDRDGVGDAFAELATARGDRCRTVRAGTVYGREGGEFTVMPGSAAQLERLFADLDQDGTPFRGTVVHLWNLDLPRFADCGETTSRGRGRRGVLPRRARRDPPRPTLRWAAARRHPGRPARVAGRGGRAAGGPGLGSRPGAPAPGTGGPPGQTGRPRSRAGTRPGREPDGRRGPAP